MHHSVRPHRNLGILDPILAASYLLPQKCQDCEDSSVIVWSHIKAKLGEDTADVFVDRSFGNEEPTGYCGVGSAFGHKRQHLTFTRRQLLERVILISYKLAYNLGIDNSAACCNRCWRGAYVLNVRPQCIHRE